MERRVLIAIFLSFIVLYVYQALTVKPVPKPVPGATTSTAANRTPESSTANASKPGPAPLQAPSVQPAARALVGESQEREIRVENQDVIAIFTNRGGKLKSWRLKHYLDQDKQPQELADATAPLPFTLQTPEEPVTAAVNGALYAVT